LKGDPLVYFTSTPLPTRTRFSCW